MASEQRDKTQAAAPLGPFEGLPPAPPTAEPRAVWPRVRAVLLVIAFAAGVALAAVGAIQHRGIFLAAAWTFAALPAVYLLAAALHARAVAPRMGEVAGALVLVGALVVATIVAIGGCEQRLGSGADLAGCDFHGAALAGKDLSGSDLSGADLSGADLRRARLDEANLTRADLRGAALDGASLAGATLLHARLDGAQLPQTDLHGADLTGARLEGAELLETDLRGAVLSDATLPGLDLSTATLTGVTFAGANLSGANLEGAGLSGANLRDAAATGIDLVGADLRGADLSGSGLGEAKLDAADLGDATIAGADLTGASLAGASLDGADLTGATLEGADLSHTSLVGATGVTDDALASAFAVDVADLGGTLIERSVTLEARDDILAAVGAACGGNPVAGAGAYRSGAFNPIVLFDRAGRGQPGFTDRPSELGWEPTATRFVNVVGCVDDEQTVTVETCPYQLQSGGVATIVRERYQRRVTLVDPRSGSVLLDETVQGSAPDACPETHVFYTASPTETFEGTHVDFNAIQHRLASFVEGRG